MDLLPLHGPRKHEWPISSKARKLLKEVLLLIAFYLFVNLEANKREKMKRKAFIKNEEQGSVCCLYAAQMLMNFKSLLGLQRSLPFITFNTSFHNKARKTSVMIRSKIS